MALIDRFWQKGKDFLGCKYPIISGAMSWISTSALVTSVCKNGGFGVLAGGNMPPELFEKEIDACIAGTNGAPFAANMITIAPVYKDQLEVVARKNVPFVVFAGTLPTKEEIAKVKDTGKKVMTFAPTETIAKRMLKFGADALIIEGMESGGHLGPVTTMILLQEILQKFRDQTNVFVAGGIGTGEMVAHLLAMGAAGVQLGTRFVMTEECQVHPEMKKAFVRAHSRNAVASTQVSPALPIVAVRALDNPACEDFAKLQIETIAKIEKGELSREDGLKIVENFWLGGLRRAVVDGDMERGSVMAGQSVGLMDSIKPMAQVFEDLVNGAEAELQRMQKLFA